VYKTWTGCNVLSDWRICTVWVWGSMSVFELFTVTVVEFSSFLDDFIFSPLMLFFLIPPLAELDEWLSSVSIWLCWRTRVAPLLLLLACMFFLLPPFWDIPWLWFVGVFWDKVLYPLNPIRCKTLRKLVEPPLKLIRSRAWAISIGKVGFTLQQNGNYSTS